MSVYSKLTIEKKTDDTNNNIGDRDNSPSTSHILGTWFTPAVAPHVLYLTPCLSRLLHLNYKQPFRQRGKIRPPAIAGQP